MTPEEVLKGLEELAKYWEYRYNKDIRDRRGQGRLLHERERRGRGADHGDDQRGG